MTYADTIRSHHAELYSTFEKLSSIRPQLETIFKNPLTDKTIRSEAGGMLDQISDLEIALREYGIGPSLIDPVDLPYEIDAGEREFNSDCRGER